MATVRTLEVDVSFVDATKRTLKFSPLAILGGSEDSMPSNFKARLKAIKNETLESIVIDGTAATALPWKQYLLSSEGNSATGITGATYTVTESTRVYDSTTYEP